VSLPPQINHGLESQAAHKLSDMLIRNFMGSFAPGGHSQFNINGPAFFPKPADQGQVWYS
jgi:hypothetical protein